MGPHPAVAAIRLAVRRVLQDVLRDLPGLISELPEPTGPTRPAEAAAAFGAPGLPAAPASPPPGLPAPSGSPGSPGSSGRTAPAAAPVPPAPAAWPAPQPPPGSQVPAARPGGAGAPDSPQNAPLVLVACSGGADSMALASAVAFEAPRAGVRAGAVTVDHRLQPGSDARAREVAERLRELGLDPVDVVPVEVGREGGPEAAARTARYAALDAAADRHRAVAVLLGHTRDDQAETVLLGLARGSGTRSLSGMAAVSGGLSGTPAAAHRYRRPFLGVDRQTTRKACLVQSIPVWDDPHNTDPAYTRSRVRHEALPVLEKALGRGVVDALARTAQLSRDDADALDAWATEAQRAATRPDGTLDIAALHRLPPAVRRRVLRRAAIAAGAPAGSLFARHIEETDRLITAWRGQRPLNLPGRVEASRQGGRLFLQQANG
ncbi:tRNA lysidine(34) synthetase TilS [Streptomyces hoynatensis]|uniref:tRNA(Ile)-lysidine synthase n=1 Tax=Streptomyces hoynatensis TaxID=1141874 RepID=A0A3A9Z3A5_9ACTN|nr:tRNA lysidine(34) synthetase TilS [Streptomyces hoynatensis]RKN42962.1 tRNA lysidine(34) synthetase TilS [Streptomyces hoynatensis]